MPAMTQELYDAFLHEKELTRKELPYEAFIKEISPTLHGVYLHSAFNQDTLNPTNHYFLVHFQFKNNHYETLLLWKMDKKLIRVLGIYEDGAYDRMYDAYSDYLKGKAVPTIHD